MSELTKSKPVNIQSALVKAMQSNSLDMDKFERFLDLQLKMEDRQAKKALNKSMAEFQNEVPIINKTKKAHQYYFASYDQVVYEIKPYLKKHGLSFSFRTSKLNEKETEMTVTVMHVEGASLESSYVYLSYDDGGKMNSSQKKKSANSYAMRVCLINVFGLATQDEDDDAMRLNDSYVTNEQLRDIEDLIIKTKTDKTKFLKYLKVEDLEEMSALDAKKALQALRQKALVK